MYLHSDLAKVGLNNENGGRHETRMTLHAVQLRRVTVTNDMIVDVEGQLGLMSERAKIEKVKDLLKNLFRNVHFGEEGKKFDQLCDEVRATNVKIMVKKLKHRKKSNRPKYIVDLISSKSENTPSK